MTITDFSALTLRLPLLDSATLSQAWRDALHQSVRSSEPSTGRQVANTLPQPRKTSVALECLREQSAAKTESRPNCPAARSICQFAVGQERLHARGMRPAHAARAHASIARRTIRETHIVTLPDGERICLLVTELDKNTQVTVLCAPHLQQDMHRALAALSRSLEQRSIGLSVRPFAKAS